jgi:peptidoglycan hydrolase CwlO-like protein
MIYYLYLLVLIFLLVNVLTSREYLTLQDVEKEGTKLNKRVKTLETQYSDIQQKVNEQNATMKSAGDQAAAAKASISAARS